MRVWISLCGVAIVTFFAYRVIPVNMTTAGFAYLLLVLVIASTWGFLEAAVCSILAALAFDYFLVPPILGFMPTKSEVWIALFSFAAEVNQPIAAAITCLHWLKRDHPDVEEAREAATRVAKGATRAAEVISRIRLLFKKGTPQHELVDVNGVIREIIVLLRIEGRDTPYRYGPNWRQILPG